jgi:plastocyanin
MAKALEATVLAFSELVKQLDHLARQRISIPARLEWSQGRHWHNGSKGKKVNRRMGYRERMMRLAGTAVLAILAGLAAIPVEATGLSVKVNDLDGKPVADAVVYAVPRAGTRVPARTMRPVAIEQKGREFVPYVTAIQVGTTANFPNLDPLLHHVYSFSPIKTFEIKLYAGDAPLVILFDKPGTVTLGCNIHDWMIGYIQVVDTPYFGKSGEDGLVQISDMVAGDFEVRLWHPTQRVAAEPKSLRIDGRSNVDLEMTMNVAPKKKHFKPPLDTVRYK